MTRLWEPGDQVEHWLVLERFLGGFGVVYVLRDLNHKDDSARPAILAAKTVRPESASDSTIEQFEMEAYRWLSLGLYKHIVRLYTVERIYGQAVAFAEYVPRGPLPNTLRGWIDAGILGFESALRFGAHICRALEHARSRGLEAHMDLKPENIMVTANGVAKVTDWGLSRGRPPRRTTVRSLADLPFRPAADDPLLPQSVHGTPGYAAPELASLSMEPGSPADMFSLGVILTEIFGGARPVPDTPVETIARTLSGLLPCTASSLAGVIAACLRSSPAARPDSIAPIETAIAEAFCEITGLRLEPPPVQSWETGADVGQRAYGLFMLGRTDEATSLQADLVARFADHSDEPAESEPEPSEPIILMDYKESGWRFVVPEQHITESEAKLASDPGNIELLSKAALMNISAGRKDRALVLYSRLIELEPNKVEWLEQKCSILENQERWDEALACYDRITSLSPPDATRWLDLAKCHEKSGDLRKAADAAAKAVAADPRSEDARNVCGHYLEQLGDYRNALVVFEGALQVNPDSALTLYNIGTCKIKLNRLDLGFQDLLAAVEKDPNFAVAFNTLGALSMQARSFQEALVFIERAIAADPHYARPWFNKGQVYEAIQKFEGAREAYLSALSIDPDYELARTALDKLEARLA